MATFKTSAILELIDNTGKGAKNAISNFAKMKKAAKGFNKEVINPNVAKSYKEFAFRTKAARDRLKELKRSMRDGKGDFDTIQREIKQTTQELKDLNKANKSFRIGGGIGKAIRGGAILGTTLSAAAVGTGFKFAEGFAEAADETDKFAKRVGFATDSISELRFVVGQTAGDEGLGALDAGLTAFNRRLGELKKGKGELTGLDDETKKLLLSARSTEEAFVLFIEKARGIEDVAAQAAFLDRGMSEAGRKLVNFARTSEKEIASLVNEARELGIVISDIDAQKATKFIDELDKVKKALMGVGFTIGAQLVEPFTRFFVEVATPRLKQFIGFLSQISSEDIEAGFARVADTLGDIVGSLAEIAGFIDAITVSKNEKNQNLALLARQRAVNKEVGFTNPFTRNREIAAAEAKVDRQILSGTGSFQNTDPDILRALQDIVRNTSGGDQSDSSLAPNVSRASNEYALTRGGSLGSDGLIPVGAR